MNLSRPKSGTSGRTELGEALPTVLEEPRYLLAVGFLAYLTIALCHHLAHNMPGDIHGDVQLYHRTIQAVWDGRLPYRDFVFEYPPYALVWFVLPGLCSNLGAFQQVFGLEMLALDLAVKGTLVWLAIRVAGRARPFLPAVLFSVAGTANAFFYLQRFDLVPAALSLWLLVAFWRERYGLAGVLLAFGTGCKLYPILFLPPLLVLAWHRRKAVPFAAGVLLGFGPLALLALGMPWWRFAAFHQARGLQVECLYASIVWLLKLLGVVSASWVEVKVWREVAGAAATACLPWARLLFLATVGCSVLFVTWQAHRLRRAGVADLARLLLVPLTAFVAFNYVLSPQYLIWLATLAAAAAASGPVRHSVCLVAAAVVIPVFYPAADYDHGLNLFETLVLVGRNALLIVAWIGLMRSPLASGCPEQRSQERGIGGAAVPEVSAPDAGL